jgi:3-oxoacyl-[acyl-carrier-protein] synthase II
MMRKKFSCFINGVGVLSPQPTFNNLEFLTSVNEYQNVLHAVHPDFKEYINPIQLRRLSRMLRMGLTASAICVRDSGNIQPDGVVTTSGYGFLVETAKFMSEILQQDEKQLTPTFFMQSTYNALSGLIALTLKCTGYNNTFVSRGHAFETGLHDAIMNLNENSNFLLGGFDEADPVDYKVLARVEIYKNDTVNSLRLFESETPGSIQGESAAFFMLGKKPTEKSWCGILDSKCVYAPASLDELNEGLNSFLFENDLASNNVDLVIHGQSGDPKKDKLTIDILRSQFNAIPQSRFKHLSGEYCTSSSFGLWLGASVLKHQRIPEITRANTIVPKQLKTVLIFNHYQGKNYSFTLLRGLT